MNNEQYMQNLISVYNLSIRLLEHTNYRETALNLTKEKCEMEAHAKLYLDKAQWKDGAAHV